MITERRLTMTDWLAGRWRMTNDGLVKFTDSADGNTVKITMTRVMTDRLGQPEIITDCR